ncbi:MAG: ABC transporter permease [Phycisphaerae bacterium]|nr:ABC transporter permease [Phycisphaerae bacterium]
MFFLRICMMAWRGLRANLLRSMLATLGVIIGVAAVISAMSILEGTKRDIIDRFKSLGSDQITVYPASARREGREVGVVQTLKPEDADAIASPGMCPDVAAAAPEVLAGAQVKYLNRNVSLTVLGTNEHYADMNTYKVVEGSFITREDVVAKRKVVVLGHKAALDLFGHRPALNAPVKIRGLGFRVIGVMEKKGNIGFRNVDSQVVVPITTAMDRMFGIDTVTAITIKAADPTRVAAATQQINRVLRQRHGIRPGDKDDFNVFNQEEQRKQFREVTNIFAVVLYSIAGISLVVGGIGIMNIMLVSVTERTREIGVRMAVGAQRWDILRQFLVEAGTISLLGGGFGVLLGYAMADLLEKVTRLIETYTPMRVVLWALGMAVVTGVLSGIYPAYKASRLDPVEALRYE